MARIRTIKPEFWTDSFMVQLPPIYRLIYIALWTAADDYGYIRDEVERVAMEIMPREKLDTVDDAIQFFIASGRIEQYCTEEGEVFYRIHKWENHQKIDHPTKSKITLEKSRKLSIPNEVRRMVAEKYGCPPGEEMKATCYYCGIEGSVHWHKLYNGNPSGWVTFPGLELDHIFTENDSVKGDQSNIVLSCRYCNRSKGTKDWLEFLLNLNKKDYLDSSIILDSSRAGREGKGKEGKGEEGNEQPPRGSVCIMNIQDLRKQMTGQMFIEQSCMALSCDEDTFRAHLEEWINTKAATGDYIYPINKLKTYCISDFKRLKTTKPTANREWDKSKVALEEIIQASKRQ